MGTPLFKTFAPPSVQKPFPTLTNFSLAILAKLPEKIAETHPGKATDAHNDRISLSALLLERRLPHDTTHQITTLPGACVISVPTPQVFTCPHICRDKG
ncbi:hypothetical protein [Allocoleopsis sp.]|uniref:hypothetical protein n=1 Tax=Allocoleopsis sp. TaxID=3088169 RepID=UPI0039C89BC5